MAFTYDRTIRFKETDAAGVVYFANLLGLCHEAYESSLQAVGIDLKLFFSPVGEVAVPIVHTAANFYQPMFCGDAIAIELVPKQLSPHSFEIAYRVLKVSDRLQRDSSEQTRPLAKALTRHVCISTCDRRRQTLTQDLQNWVEQFADPLAELEAADD